MRSIASLGVLLVTVIAWGCHHGGSTSSGSFRALSYNVAGLPPGVTKSRAKVNTPKISPLLNDYDVVLVQEDFVFHPELESRARHAYQSRPKRAKRGLVGDGLNRFSMFPLGNMHREPWHSCHGYVSNGWDCMSEKGIAVSTLALGGNEIDLYNVHMDAGRKDGDADSRADQIEQLIALINKRSKRRAVIVAGDTNLHLDASPTDRTSYSRLLEHTSLLDSCEVVGCDDPYSIDRFLFRSADQLTLEPITWTHDEDFVDEEGAPLSDHPAVVVEFDWLRSR